MAAAWMIAVAACESSPSLDAAIDVGPVYLRNEGACEYRDYGSTCDVACDVPPDVPITVTITWSGPYCCNYPPEIAPPQESFVDCRCEAGSIVCPRSVGATMRSLPASSCEFCPGTPSGS